MTTYLKSTGTASGSYTLVVRPPRLGWQNQSAYIFAVEHPDDVTYLKAKTAAERTVIYPIPADDAPPERWVVQYDHLGRGRIAAMGVKK